MPTEYQFAFGVDANYVKYAGVLMTSIVLNNPAQPICFHLASDELHAEDKANLDLFVKLYRNTRLIIYDVHTLLMNLPGLAKIAPERLNKSVFLRVLLPNFLPKELTKVIYLDADMLCIGKLDTLWQTNLAGQAVAASFYPNPEKHVKRLQLTDGRYFNAGMMVMDLTVWRQKNLPGQILTLYRHRGQEFPLLEQDCLNCILQGQITEISAHFNHMMDAFNPSTAKILPDDALLHFVNEGKPWIRYSSPLIEQLYWSYVRRSPWFTMQADEPWDAKTALCAGKNAKLQGKYKDAAHYLELAADRLMHFFIEQAR